jgi:hypothetical protein
VFGEMKGGSGGNNMVCIGRAGVVGRSARVRARKEGGGDDYRETAPGWNCHALALRGGALAGTNTHKVVATGSETNQ